MRIIGAMVGLTGRNYYFEHCNRNKRSVVLDLRTAQGIEAMLTANRYCDVFLNNMSIQAPERMGLGPEVLLASNPKTYLRPRLRLGAQRPGRGRVFL